MMTLEAMTRRGVTPREVTTTMTNLDNRTNGGMEATMQMPCIHERCQDCPHWTGIDCDGDLDADDMEA